VGQQGTGGGLLGRFASVFFTYRVLVFHSFLLLVWQRKVASSCVSGLAKQTKQSKPQPSFLPPTPTCQAKCGEREKWYGTRYSTQPLPQDWLQVRWSGCRLSGGQPLANAARSLAAAAASTAFGKRPAAFCRVSCAMLSLLRSVLASCSLLCPASVCRSGWRGLHYPSCTCHTQTRSSRSSLAC
jgi:hypothetical protein